MPNSEFRLKNIENEYDDGVNSGYRTEYRRDYARIIYSPSFRRLEGKTQLFPGQESDFFRNRLTHSLEVAQISKTIAYKFISKYDASFIEPDVCEIAGLLHDLGHPPFGHNGEKALDDCMKKYGGFEGNAQTIHIITKLEKKDKLQWEDERVFHEDGTDNRLGLNLTVRSIASALKYDFEIPEVRGKKSKVKKGYYKCDKSVVDIVKEQLVSSKDHKKFKTIECKIMDISDDIAYSTYDIEDAFKAGFLTPLEMMSQSDSIYDQISKKLKKDKITADRDECRSVVINLFFEVFDEIIREQKSISENDVDFEKKTITNILNSYSYSKNIASDGYLRTKFSSLLISKFINGVTLKIDKNDNLLSKVIVNKNIKKEISILKHFAFICLINSSRLKVVENRGYEIVKSIFDKINEDEGYKLLPEDFQQIYHDAPTEILKKRVICDFIAGMTDRYALEFYSRLYSENPQTIFKPL